MYLVLWEIENGTTGHGEPMDFWLAIEWVNYMKQLHPTHKYWVIKE
jgi:hypothetical protein